MSQMNRPMQEGPLPGFHFHQYFSPFIFTQIHKMLNISTFRWLQPTRFLHIMQRRDNTKVKSYIHVLRSQASKTLLDMVYGLCTALHEGYKIHVPTFRNSSRRDNEHCQLTTKGHPYFMLAPLRCQKTEMLRFEIPINFNLKRNRVFLCNEHPYIP